MLKFNLQKKLLFGSTIIVVIVFLSLFIILYNYLYSISIKEEFDTLNLTSERVSTQVNELFRQMDMSALFIAKNELIHQILDELYTREFIPEHEMITYSSQIRSQLNILTYYFPNTTNVTLFDATNNFYFHSGLPNNKEEVKNRLEDINWYNSLIPIKNSFKILPPHQDFWVTIDRPVISIIREIKSTKNSRYGLFEFDIPYWNLENICSLNTVTPNTYVLIFNDEGSLVYPFNKSDNFISLSKKIDINDMFNTINSMAKTNGTYISVEKKYLYSTSYSNYTNWHTILIRHPSSMIKSQKIYLLFTILFVIILTIIVTISFFILIKTLTKPLINLIKNVKHVSIDNLHLKLPSQGNDDIDLLNNSFNIMFDNIKNSVNQIYEAKLREVKANLLALQAQINPHFIYNTLNVISVSSERHGITETTIMCNKLSNMLRYVANSDNSLVTLSDELQHMTDYLDLMKTHYTDFNNPDKVYLDYTANVPETMLSLPLPKMTIQPLVENSINHGFNNTMPPWRITITGDYINENHWSLTVADNGSGFDNDILRKLNKKIIKYEQNLSQGNFEQNTHIGGMGIMNTYTRLAINYRPKLTFTIKNTEPCGTSIKIEINDLKEDK